MHSLMHISRLPFTKLQQLWDITIYIFVLFNKICHSGLSLLDNRTDSKLQISICWWSLTLLRVPVLYVCA